MSSHKLIVPVLALLTVSMAGVVWAQNADTKTVVAESLLIQDQVTGTTNAAPVAAVASPEVAVTPPVELKAPAANTNASLDSVEELAKQALAAPPPAPPAVAATPPAAEPPAAVPPPVVTPPVVEAPPAAVPPPAVTPPVVEAPPAVTPPPVTPPAVEPPAVVTPPVAEPPPAPPAVAVTPPAAEPPAAVPPPAVTPPVEAPPAVTPPPATPPAVAVDDIVAKAIKEAMVDTAVTQVPPATVVAPPPDVVAHPAAVPAVPAPPPAIAGKATEPETDLDRLIQEALKEALAEGIPVAPPVVKEGAVDITAKAGQLNMLENAEVIRRKATEDHAREILRQAQSQLKKEEFDDAIKNFKFALQYFDYFKRPETQKERQDAREGLRTAYFQKSLALERMAKGVGKTTYSKEELMEALKAAKSAQLQGHPDGERQVIHLQDLIDNPPRIIPPIPPARWEEKDYLDTEKRVNDSLRRGREHMMVGEYDKAQLQFESVLALQPQNTEAIRLLHKIGGAKYDKATMELEATRRGMMGDLRKTWNPRDYIAITETKKVDTTSTGKRENVEESLRAKVLRKLENIEIPKVEFIQAHIQEVVKTLQDESLNNDRSDDVKKGVNFILKLRTGTGGGAAPADPFAGAGAAAPPTPGADSIPKITFQANYISLLQALKIVADVSGLKWYIDGGMVMIVPKDWVQEEIVVRTYDVLPAFVERQKTLTPELTQFGAGAGVGGAPPAGGAAVAAPAGDMQAELKALFEKLGVKWPAGSSIYYIQSVGKLVVGNTEENLVLFEQVLKWLNVVPNQIEIETRFVEIRQTDAHSLGLEWLLTDTWEVAQRKSDAGKPIGARQRIQIAGNAGTGGFTKGLRYLDAAGTSAIPDDIMRIASVLTNPELAMVLHMLEQKGNADLLSAPKVTAKAGQQAVIKVVTEYIYPTTFTVTPITATAGGGAGAATIVGGIVEPSGFEMREVGVIMEVTPNVSPDGKMIDLQLVPRVVSDPTWKNYGSTYTDPVTGGTVQLPMEQPFFHTRSISTSVQIYNDATVVMGGMINELRNDVDDRIPFLGDIPLLGRVFRSKHETSEKRNLLIFVTARLVDPAGKPLDRTGAGVFTTQAETAALTKGVVNAPGGTAAPMAAPAPTP